MNKTNETFNPTRKLRPPPTDSMRGIQSITAETRFIHSVSIRHIARDSGSDNERIDIVGIRSRGPTEAGANRRSIQARWCNKVQIEVQSRGIRFAGLRAQNADNGRRDCLNTESV